MVSTFKTVVPMYILECRNAAVTAPLCYSLNLLLSVLFYPNILTIFVETVSSFCASYGVSAVHVKLQP